MVNFGPITAENCWRVWGTPANFNGFGGFTARYSSSGRQPNFAALNRGRHLYWAGRPSHWALAHISSYYHTLVWYWYANSRTSITLPLVGVWSNAMIVFVCLVCLNISAVCLFARVSQKQRVQTLRIFCTCYPWRRLGPALTTMQYVLYFRFFGWRHVCP